MSLVHLSDYTRENIIADKIGVEGGGQYTNNPNDHGGETKYGMTGATCNAYRTYLMAHMGWDGTMINLTQAQAVYVYIQEFWNKMSLDQIHAAGTYGPLVADLLFEAGINFNHVMVGEWLQKALNVLNNKQSYYNDIAVDGNIGAQTANALNRLQQSRPRDGARNVLFMVSAQASVRYIDIAIANASQEMFESGWENRARIQYGTYCLFFENQ